MARQFRNNVFTVVVVAAIAGVVVTLLVLFLSPAGLGDWLRTLAATSISALLAVAIGIGLFNHQTDITDRQRTRRLILVSEAEIQDILSVLTDSRPETLSPVTTKSGARRQTLLTEFQLISIDEAARSGLFSVEDTVQLIYLAGAVRTYNFAVQHLLSVMLVMGVEIEDHSIDQLEAKRKGITNLCQDALARLGRLKG